MGDRMTIRSRIAAFGIAGLLALAPGFALAQSNPGQPPLGFPFVAKGAAQPDWGGDVFHDSGRPWCDVRAKGALAYGVTDDAAAFAACVTEIVALPGGRGDILIPSAASGFYCVKSAITTPTASAIRFIFSNSTKVSTCGADVTLFDLSGAYTELLNGRLCGSGCPAEGTGTFGPPTKRTVIIENTCVGCRITNTIITGGTGTEFIGGDTRITNSEFSFSYGSALRYIGSASVVAAGAGTRFEGTKADQAWPQGLPTAPITINAWAGTTAYTTPVVVSSGGYLLQLKTNGTSGGSAPTLKNYGFDITDGTAVWRLVGPATYYSAQFDTNASEILLHFDDASGSFTSSYAMTNTLAGTPPQFIHLNGPNVASQGTSHDIDMQAGSDLFVEGSNEISGCLLATCSGVNVAANLSRVNVSGAIFGSTIGGNAVKVAAGTGDSIFVYGNALNGLAHSIAPTNANGYVEQNGTIKTGTWTGTTNAKANGGTGCTTTPCVQALVAPSQIIFTATGVNFNSATTDTTIPITLPTGFTRYVVATVRISGASASISTATAGVFTGAGATGQTVAATQAITVTTASDNANNNAMSLTLTNGSTESYTAANLFFRVTTAQGAAATGTVTIAIAPLP